MKNNQANSIDFSQVLWYLDLNYAMLIAQHGSEKDTTMPRKKAGQAQVVTRAANRKILSAIQPGSLENTKDGKTMFARRLYKQLQTMCSTWANDKIPPFSANTAPLDRWLQGQLDEERTGFLAAFIDQAAMITSNLHYRLIGSRPLVSRTLDILNSSEGSEGFRKLLKINSLNFYCSNFGGAVYLNRSEPVQASYLPNADKWYFTTPPVENMYATDSTLFQNNNDFIFPFSYDGELWNRYDFFRIVSMPSTRLSTWGVGRCPLWRCIQMSRMMNAVYDHVYGSLSPDTARGVITVKGLSTQEFLEALSGSEAVNESDELSRDGALIGDGLGDIVVLADREEEIIVKYVTMSRLPDGFFIDAWTRWSLSVYSSSLGYSLDEFLGSPSNRLLGQSGAEVTQNAQRTSTKGGSELATLFQNALQANVIPPTVQFEFSARDIDNELQDVQLKQAKADLVISLFEANQPAIINKGDVNIDTLLEAKARGSHVIDRDEARRLLTELGVVSWLSEERNPDIVLDDSSYDLSTYRLKSYREEFRESKYIQRLAMQPVGDQVVLYENWVDRMGFQKERELVLWDDDRDLIRPTNWMGVDLSARSADNIGPNDFKRRTPNKKITKEMALDSDHASVITRLLRKHLLRQAESSIEEFVPIKSLISDKDSEVIVGRIYAITQAGRDSVLNRRKISDQHIAELAGRSLQYAKDRWAALLGNSESPQSSRLDETIDQEIGRMVEVTLAANPQIGDEDTLPVIMSALEEYIKPRALEIGQREAGLAFDAGADLAIEIVNIRVGQEASPVV